MLIYMENKIELVKNFKTNKKKKKSEIYADKISRYLYPTG